ncbi:hypothetical protein NEF87_003453 [Candidatus Lokiarchaeum ossiferum]|uniref:N-acetyltransferase domain-containing protein n=1 Tax=Candidatus Lokiarchaeum ossiferum TaxID=2951803 RepID=A0ABY6HUH2_9ARCH|nr:hypothetical protein NEF87_003453 [Candidatus Lokiarchaeum sp. B-35]
MKLPTLESNRLILRPLKESDLDFFRTQYSDPLVQKYTMLSFQTDVELQDFYSRGCGIIRPDQFRIMLEIKNSHEPIGSIVIENWDQKHQSAEIGYDLSPHFWHQGFMNEALTVMLEYIFLVLNVNRVEATVNPTNIQSIKLLKKCRFVQEGILRQKYYYQGIFHDEIIFSLLKDDFRRNNGQ